MKKIVFCLLTLTALAGRTQAQTEKGDWLVGGNMTINTTSGNSQFTLQPSAGYFFAHNFAAGAEFLLSFGKFGDEKTSTVGIGPFARYYFDLKEGHFKPFVHTSVDFASQTTKIPDGGGTTIKTSNTITSFFIGAGGAFFINDNVALEVLAGYNNSKVQSQTGQGGFLFRVGFQVHLLGSEVKRK